MSDQPWDCDRCAPFPHDAAFCPYAGRVRTCDLGHTWDHRCCAPQRMDWLVGTLTEGGRKVAVDKGGRLWRWDPIIERWHNVPVRLPGVA